MQTPLDLTKLRVKGDDAVALLNGHRRIVRREEKKEAVSRPLVLVFALAGLSLSIGIVSVVLRLFPDVRRYLRLRSM